MKLLRLLAAALLAVAMLAGCGDDPAPRPATTPACSVVAMVGTAIHGKPKGPKSKKPKKRKHKDHDSDDAPETPSPCPSPSR